MTLGAKPFKEHLHQKLTKDAITVHKEPTMALSVPLDVGLHELELSAPMERVRSSAVLARDPLIRGASLLSQVGSALTWAEFLQFAFQFGNCES